MFCITDFLCLRMIFTLSQLSMSLLQIEAETKGSWKKLLVFLNENNVAVPLPVSKDDEADSRREAAELDSSVHDEL